MALLAHHNVQTSIAYATDNKWMIIFSALLIAISIAVPGILYVGNNNLQALTGDQDNELSIHLFLRNQTDAKQAQELQQQLERDRRIARVQFISTEQALADFADVSPLGELMQKLNINILPNVLHVYPIPSETEQGLQGLIEDLYALPQLEQLQFDQYWAQSFRAILDIVQTVVVVVFQLLLIEVFVIISHNIHVLVTRKRSEIRVLKLIGAPDSFITLPFIILGGITGLLGSLFALLFLLLTMWLIQDPVQVLIGFYQSEHTVQGLTIMEYALVLFVPALVATLAAFISCRSLLERDL